MRENIGVAATLTAGETHSGMSNTIRRGGRVCACSESFKTARFDALTKHLCCYELNDANLFPCNVRLLG